MSIHGSFNELCIMYIKEAAFSIGTFHFPSPTVLGNRYSTQWQFNGFTQMALNGCLLTARLRIKLRCFGATTTLPGLIAELFKLQYTLIWIRWHFFAMAIHTQLLAAQISL